MFISRKRRQRSVVNWWYTNAETWFNPFINDNRVGQVFLGLIKVLVVWFQTLDITFSTWWVSDFILFYLCAFKSLSLSGGPHARVQVILGVINGNNAEWHEDYEDSLSSAYRDLTSGLRDVVSMYLNFTEAESTSFGLKEYYDIVDEARPLSGFFPTEMHL